VYEPVVGRSSGPRAKRRGPRLGGHRRPPTRARRRGAARAAPTSSPVSGPATSTTSRRRAETCSGPGRVDPLGRQMGPLRRRTHRLHPTRTAGARSKPKSAAPTDTSSRSRTFRPALATDVADAFPGALRHERGLATRSEIISARQSWSCSRVRETSLSAPERPEPANGPGSKSSSPAPGKIASTRIAQSPTGIRGPATGRHACSCIDAAAAQA
jgi:hypothetical protein